MFASLLLLALFQAPPQTDFRVDVDLVNVTFTVRDNNGALQSSLSASDLTVLEDGVPQQPRFFSRKSDTPLLLGIVMDLSGSQIGLVRKNIDMAVNFLRNILQPNDRVFVASFDGRIKIVQDFTSSLSNIESAILNIRERHKQAPMIQAGRGGASPVRDAIYLCARDKLKRVQGRKALLLISDGDDNASRTSAGDTIEMLQSADTILYSLNPGASTASKWSYALAPQMYIYDRLSTANDLRRMATESGGQAYKVSKVNLKDTFSQIEAELRTMYTIGYVSSNARNDGAWHKLEVRPTQPGLTVRARPGYRAPNQ